MGYLKNIRSALIAASYDLIMLKTEQRCLSHWRRELLAHARGAVLEIGAGTGLNLPYYTPAISHLTLSEPDRHMYGKLSRAIAQCDHGAEINNWSVEQIGMPDNTFDTIVSTLVLCSVSCQATSLKQIKRLLKPGGQLLFMEHVRSDKPRVLRWQQRLEPTWSLCVGDCRLTRDTQTAIESAGFELQSVTEAPIPGTPAIVSRTIRGIARKPLSEIEP